VIEGMDSQFLERVVDTLFPKGGEESRPPTRPCMAEDWSLELGVSEKELAEAVGRIGARQAPGPDGIPARLRKGTAGELAPRLRRLFDRCLAWGEFPGLWKEGRMVLLPKPGRPPDSPLAFRPLCLLDEVEKV
jgi:hypothetical protein